MGAAQRTHRQHPPTPRRTGTAAARGSAPSSPTRAPPVTRSTPSVELTETGARALCRNVEIRGLHPAQEPPLRSLARNQERNLERNQVRNLGRNHPRENLERSRERSQERSQGRSQERSQERSQARNQERSQERNLEKERNQSQEKERNQTKAGF